MGSLLRWQKEHYPGITEQATRTPTPRQRDDVPLGSSLGSVDPDDSESDLFSEASTNGESADYTDIFDDMTPPMEPRTWRVEHDNGRFEVERIPYQHINYGDA